MKKNIMHPPGPEQRLIIDAVAGGRHVMVDAVPGAGKTTTVLCMAREMPGTALTVVTYNKAIKLEMRARAATVGLRNLDIHTYHSLARKYYDKKCADDGAISRILGGDAPLLPGAGRRPSVLVVDECQDMTPQYCRLVKKFLRGTRGDPCCDPGGDQRGEPVLCFLGDTMQSVYGFKKADPRFLSLAAGVFGVAAEPVRLASTYRLTKPVAADSSTRVCWDATRSPRRRAGPPSR